MSWSSPHLLPPPPPQIRRVACDQLYTLSQSDTSGFQDVQKPNLFLLTVILSAQLPLWSPTSVMRGVNQRYPPCCYSQHRHRLDSQSNA